MRARAANTVRPNLAWQGTVDAALSSARQSTALPLHIVFGAAMAIALAMSCGGFMPARAYAAGSDSVITEIGAAVAQKEREVRANAGLPEDGRLSHIAEVGAAVSRKMEEARLLEPVSEVDYTQHVGEIFQNDVMAAGCELVSLEIALESMGMEVDLDSLVSDYLNMDGSYSTGYAGDPYWSGGGFAPGIAAAANGYLENAGSSVRAYDLTGAPFDVLAAYIAHGYPVLVWTTMGFDDPSFTGVFDGEDEWYDNEHCVVLYGLSDDGEWALVSDPLEGYVDRELPRFIDIYVQCGSRAVVFH